jgi:hypothetical protein
LYTGITLAIAALLKFTSLLDPVIDGLKNFGDAIGLTDFAAEEKEKKTTRKGMPKLLLEQIKDLPK